MLHSAGHIDRKEILEIVEMRARLSALRERGLFTKSGSV